jgi:hypothetical protein
MKLALASCQVAVESIDTYAQISIPDYFKILKELEFKIIYDESFTGENSKERFYILFNYSRSILMRFDTYTYPDGEVIVNSSKMYYNWICKEPSMASYIPGKKEFSEIGGEFIWKGECDALVDLKRKLEFFDNVGEFIDWRINPRFSLLNYAENLSGLHHYNYYKLNRLPNEVLFKIAL